LQNDNIFASEIDFASSGNAPLAALNDDAVDQVITAILAPPYRAEFLDQ
jgi:hypothetical protein